MKASADVRPQTATAVVKRVTEALDLPSAKSEVLKGEPVRATPTVAGKEERYVNLVTELAMHLWEAPAEWPDARDSLLESLTLQGAQVKSEGSSIVKREKSDWFFVKTEENGL